MSLFSIQTRRVISIIILINYLSETSSRIQIFQFFFQFFFSSRFGQEKRNNNEEFFELLHKNCWKNLSNKKLLFIVSKRFFNKSTCFCLIVFDKLVFVRLIISAEKFLSPRVLRHKSPKENLPKKKRINIKNK